MSVKLCCICDESYITGGHNPYPIFQLSEAKQCCNKCNEKKVIPARMRVANWTHTVLKSLVETCGINNAQQDDEKYRDEIIEALTKYINRDWGETCKSDSDKNNKAVWFANDRIVAKYSTSKGDVFIITESDRSVTTILFSHEF